jgi:hypothetical protein
MKISEVILIIIAILLVVIAAELGAVIASSRSDASMIADSNRELSASNSRLETIMAGVGENLEIVVNKFCGDRKKK